MFHDKNKQKIHIDNIIFELNFVNIYIFNTKTKLEVGNEFKIKNIIYNTSSSNKSLKLYTSRIGIVNCNAEILQRTRVTRKSKGGCQSQQGHSHKVMNTFHHI